MEKVSFYFNEDKEKFASVVKRMPGANLKELIKVIQDSRKSNEAKESEIKKEEEKVEEKSEDLKI